MKDINWDDLQVFYHVAETGGLSGAARVLDLSAPTVGRRMLALEQRTGQILFERSQTGYRLTQAGVTLMQRVRAMHAAARPVQELLSADRDRPEIRLSAGTATTIFLADRINVLTRPGDPFRLNFVTTEAMLDIAHRQVDLGIRNRPAQSGNLASRRLNPLRFAPYRSHGVSHPDLLEWVAIDPAHARHPAGHWLHAQNLPVAVQASSMAIVHQLIRAGAGIGIIPCMVGDSDPSLARAGPIIDELTETQYLVMHNDDRHLPHLRLLIERIVQLHDENADLLAGARPLRDRGA